MIKEKKLLDTAVDYALEPTTSVERAIGAMKLVKLMIGQKKFLDAFAHSENAEDAARYDAVAEKLSDALEQDAKARGWQ